MAEQIHISGKRPTSPTAVAPSMVIMKATPMVLLGTQNRVGGLMRWSVNNVSFAYPGDPLLLADAAAADVSVSSAQGNETGLESDDAEALPPLIDVAAAHGGANVSGWVQLASAELAQNRSGGLYARSVEAAEGTATLSVPFGAVVDLVLQNAPALNGVLEQQQHP